MGNPSPNRYVRGMALPWWRKFPAEGWAREMRTQTDTDTGRAADAGADPDGQAAGRERVLLVGRAAELRAAREALRTAGAVLLTGPAGIGRSALAGALAAEAAAGGAVVLRCAPSGEERALPYVALVDLFADLPERRLAALLDGLPEGQRAALCDALLRGRRPGTDLDRLALRVGVLQLLRTLAVQARAQALRVGGTAGLLVVLDGLQGIDGPSAEVLRFVLRRTGRLGVQVLATERVQSTERAAWVGGGSGVGAGAGAGGVGAGGGGPLGWGREVCPPETVELALSPLGPAALAELLVRDRGGPLPAGVLRDVQQVSAGNPRHALELARSGFRLGTDGAGPVPRRLSERVLERLRELSSQEHGALLLAAVGSRPSLAELRVALGGREPLLLLASALRSGLVELGGGGGAQAGAAGRVGFADPLVRVVLLARAAPAELALARRSLASAVAEPGERARLRALSRPGESEEATAAVLAAAADRARSRGALAEAYRLAYLAARHTPGLAAPQDADRVGPGTTAVLMERLLTAAEYAYQAGRWQEAQALAAELLDTTAPVHAPAPARALAARTRARAVLVRSSGYDPCSVRELVPQARAGLHLISGGGRDAVALGTVGAVSLAASSAASSAASLAGTASAGAAHEAALRRWSAESALSAGRIVQAEREVVLAVDLAGQAGDAAGRAAALGVLAAVQTFRGDLADARRTLAEGIATGTAASGWEQHPVRWELQRRQAAADLDADRTSAALARLDSLTREVGDGMGLSDLLESLILRVRTEATSGDGVAAMASMARLRDLLAELGLQPEASAAVLAGAGAGAGIGGVAGLAGLTGVDGRWRAGAANGPASASAGPTVAPGAVPTAVGAGPVLYAWALAELAGGSGARAGELAGHAVVASAADGDRVHQVRALGTVGAAHLLAGNAAAVAAGAEALQEARRLGGRLGMADPESARRLALLAESLVALGEYGEATKALAEARGLERGWGEEGFSGRARAAVDRAEGLAQAGLGNTLQGVFLLRGAVDRLWGARLPLEAAWTLMALGSVERRSRHRAAARAALVQAREIAVERRAFPLLGRVERELERLEHGGVGSGADGARLTASERRVAGLAADGATNREVAAALYVSVKTVEGTLSRVYRKLGVRSRAGLARALAAQG